MNAAAPDVTVLLLALVALTVKHVVADFLLQTRWMALGKEGARDWVAPLAIHVAWHGAGTFLVAFAVAPGLWWLALVDMAVHAAIDIAKSSIVRRAGWDTSDTPFWWAIGLDQMLHQLTNIGLAAALVLAR